MTLLGSLLSLGALAVNATLLVLVFRHRPRTEASWAFLALVGSFVLWDAAEAVLRALPPPGPDLEAAYWALLRLEWSGTAFIPGALLHFVLVYPATHPFLRHRFAYVLLYGPSIAILSLEVGSDAIIRGAYPGPLGYDAGFGPGYLAAALVYGLLILAALAVLAGNYRRAHAGIDRKRARDLLLGFSVPVLVGGTTDLFWGPVTGDPTRLGLGTAYTVVLAVFIAHAILRYKFLEIKPVREEAGGGVVPVGLQRGRSHLVLETGKVARFAAFRDLATRVPGLCVTGTAPAKVRDLYGLRAVPVLWLTAVSSTEPSVRLSSLNFELLLTLQRFTRENRDTVVLVDDLDLMVALAGFEEVARFVKTVVNLTVEARSTLICGVHPRALAPEQLAVLQGMFDATADLTGLTLELSGLPADASVLVRGRHAETAPAAAAYSRSEELLVVTTAHPAKALEAFGASARVLWLADQEGAAARPTQLDAQATRAVKEFVQGVRSAPCIALPDVEQLLLYNPPSALLAFLKDVLDLAATRRGRVVATADPEAFDSRTLAVLEGRFDRVVD